MIARIREVVQDKRRELPPAIRDQGTVNDMRHRNKIRSTTVLCVRRGAQVAIAGDGQVSLGDTVVKHSARKVRRLGKSGEILAGFAGSTADALTLLEKFEQ